MNGNLEELCSLATPKELPSFFHIVGYSPPMKEIFSLINDLSSCETPVLIQGESGTGKELIAQTIHQTSPRASRPLQVINCGALSEGLLESELFGHVKGAFTSALFDKKGLFAQAHGGTLFLDEIGEISPAFQVKLLRVLQNGEYQPVGSNERQYSDVRIIAATNQNLQIAMQNGKFREDLYYRLNVIGIRVPPLRERVEDISLLVDFFLSKFNQKLGKLIQGISTKALMALQNYDWAGNVRELENLIERCVVLNQNSRIEFKDLPKKIFAKTREGNPHLKKELFELEYKKAKYIALKQFNQAYMSQLLKQSRGNITLASQRAGMDRSNFKKIIRKYQINIKEFRRD